MDLGGDYATRCSEGFILLSAWEPQAAGELLIFAEQTLRRIEESLREAAWQSGRGQHVIYASS